MRAVAVDTRMLLTVLMLWAPSLWSAEATNKHKARSIIIPQLQFGQATVGEGVRFLIRRSRDLDPDKKGVVIVMALTPEEKQLKFDLGLKDVSIADAAKYVATAAGLTMTFEGDAIFISEEEVRIQRALAGSLDRESAEGAEGVHSKPVPDPTGASEVSTKNEARQLSERLSAALNEKSKAGILACFNLEGIDERGRRQVEEDIVDELLTWDAAKVSVVPFSESPLGRIDSSKFRLVGRPLAFVSFSSKDLFFHPFVAGSSPDGFLILLGSADKKPTMPSLRTRRVEPPEGNLSVLYSDDAYIFTTQSDPDLATAAPKLLVHSKPHNAWLQIESINTAIRLTPNENYGPAAFPADMIGVDSRFYGDWPRPPKNFDVEVPIDVDGRFVFPDRIEVSKDGQIYKLRFVTRAGNPGAGIYLEISIWDLDVDFKKLNSR